ncbi:hypothetical protein BD626DRAFT_482567 [Schizophyllum amplum]|uniref:Uncharacterized protein n=1 Tax=Schizophyllum amplum TaxID=97359 RepID=A0A550CVB1_9AGAR|nr:hypothetical protein BD626DRAFT_482567 [Auriculariopsis ampla]
MVPQIQTRLHLSSTAEGDESDLQPRIPELIDHFDDGQGKTYRIANAIEWLSTVPPPPGHLLGPLGGACIRHRFFHSDDASEPYASVQALERYIEKNRAAKGFTRADKGFNASPSGTRSSSARRLAYAPATSVSTSTAGRLLWASAVSRTCPSPLRGTPWPMFPTPWDGLVRATRTQWPIFLLI